MVAPWGSHMILQLIYLSPNTFACNNEKGFNREKAIKEIYTISYPTDSSKKKWNNEKKFWLVGLISGIKNAPGFIGDYNETGSIGFHWFFGLPGSVFQWLLLVPLKGGRWHIIPQLAVYTTYIPLIYCLLGGLYATYHLLGEPETFIEFCFWYKEVHPLCHCLERWHGGGVPLL